MRDPLAFVCELVENLYTFGFVPISFDPVIEKSILPIPEQTVFEELTVIVLTLSIKKLKFVSVCSATVA